MKIKNIGNKIVNIGAIAILPGEVTDKVANSYKNNPIIDTLKKMKFIAILNDKPAKTDEAETEAEKGTAETVSEAETSGDKKSAKAGAKAEEKK